MGYNSPDIYYQPEKFGLTPVAEIDYSSGNYEFDLRVVWKDKDGKLYTARDSGCSCPSPFEDYTSLDKAEELDIGKLEKELEEEEKSSYEPISPAKAKEFLDKVKTALQS